MLVFFSWSCNNILACFTEVNTDTAPIDTRMYFSVIAAGVSDFTLKKVSF